MRILLVDTDKKILEKTKEHVSSLLPNAEILSHESSLTALAAARKKKIDIAFLETEMPEMDGLLLGRYLRDINPQINLIYQTEKAEHGYDAFRLHASGYILKPADSDRMKEELDDLRHPVGKNRHKRVFAQTFGNFEFFVDGKPVAFKYSRTKEVVALLINNRGAQTTNGEIIACLWEDDGDPEKKGSYLSNLRQDLQNTMTRLRLTGIILKQRGSMAIATDAIECDLYDWLEKKKKSRYSYMGDYMNQYSWAELVHAELDEISYAMEEE